jgi:biotin-dependent carboxylase-like uncharacterized protein
MTRTIEVESPGLFTTVQDLGRYGYGPRGVSASGAADTVALRIGNLLVGNRESTAALEMTLTGGTFGFPEGAIIALAGSDFGAETEGAAVPPWTAYPVRPGGTLKTGRTREGARCYLCVNGGIEVKLLLGSASTHVLSGLGGFEGRPLRKGDRLALGPATNVPLKARRLSAALDRLRPRKLLRTTIAPQTSLFPEDSRRAFYSSAYVVSEESNRMGIRLKGNTLDTPFSGHMLSEGAPLGAIQVPAGGQPIILFVEHQTTGGYPKIANVISADLASLGQLRPRDEIRFELVTSTFARELIRAQEQMLRPEVLFRRTRS